MHGDRWIGFKRDYLTGIGGEQNADPRPGQTVEIEDLEIKHDWFTFESETDEVRLNDVFSPNDLVVGYAFCHLESEEREKVMLSVGSNDGIKIWLNGELVHRFHVPHGRWLQKDDDYVPVELQQGTNRLLLKIDEGSGDFGFVVRLLDYKETVTNLRAHLAEHKHLSVITREDEVVVTFGTPHRIEALSPGNQVKIDIVDEAGEIVDTQWGTPGFEQVFPLEKVPEGRFTVRAEFALSDGERAVTEKEHFKGLLPRHPLPKRLGPDLAMRNDDGKPFFPIGTYGAPVDRYEKIREAGYTFVVGGTGSLDAAEAAGLKMGVSIHGHGDGWLDEIRKTVRAHRDHPALLFWMLFDEPGYNKADLMLIHDAYNLIYEEDPVHPVYLVITNPKVYETFGRCCDVLAVDTYPISRSDISKVPENIARAYRVSDGDQPVWHCGQLFSWPADRYPTPQEHRLMTYSAIQAGTKAMLWYTYSWRGNALPETVPLLWEEHLKIMAELKELEPVIVYPGLGEKLGTGHHSLRATAKRGPGNSLTVFAVNVSEEKTVTSRIQLPTTFTGDIEVLFENRSQRIEDGLLCDEFSPLTVHIYQIGRAHV